MTSWILSGMDSDLEQRIRELAWRDGVTLNEVVLQLLKQGAEADAAGVGSALDDASLDANEEI